MERRRCHSRWHSRCRSAAWSMQTLDLHYFAECEMCSKRIFCGTAGHSRRRFGELTFLRAACTGNPNVTGQAVIDAQGCDALACTCRSNTLSRRGRFNQPIRSTLPIPALRLRTQIYSWRLRYWTAWLTIKKLVAKANRPARGLRSGTSSTSLWWTRRSTSTIRWIGRP